MLPRRVWQLLFTLEKPQYLMRNGCSAVIVKTAVATCGQHTWNPSLISLLNAYDMCRQSNTLSPISKFKPPAHIADVPHRSLPTNIHTQPTDTRRTYIRLLRHRSPPSRRFLGPEQNQAGTPCRHDAAVRARTDVVSDGAGVLFGLKNGGRAGVTSAPSGAVQRCRVACGAERVRDEDSSVGSRRRRVGASNSGEGIITLTSPPCRFSPRPLRFGVEGEIDHPSKHAVITVFVSDGDLSFLVV